MQLAPRQQLGEQLELFGVCFAVGGSEAGFGDVVGLRGEGEVVFVVAGREVEGVGDGSLGRVELWVSEAYVCTCS